jgi:hypothetical protein
MARSRKRSRRNLGLVASEHAAEGMNWYSSARKIVTQADATMQRDPCRAIEHYTDAIAEGTVAEVQFVQAGDENNSEMTARFLHSATMSQRKAVRLCVRGVRK